MFFISALLIILLSQFLEKEEENYPLIIVNGKVAPRLSPIFFHTEKSSESECMNYCRHIQNCAFYTYFLEEDPNSKLCVLLSHLIEPFQPCSIESDPFVKTANVVGGISNPNWSF